MQVCVCVCVCIRVYVCARVPCSDFSRSLPSLGIARPTPMQHLPTPRPVAADKLHKHHMHHKYLPQLTLLEQGMDSDQIHVTLVQGCQYLGRGFRCMEHSKHKIQTPLQRHVLSDTNATREIKCVERVRNLISTSITYTHNYARHQSITYTHNYTLA